MPNCRICKADNSKQQVRADFVFGGKPEHKFWQCGQCEAVYLYPIPSEEEEEYFYKKEFEKFMASRSGADRNWDNAKAHLSSNQDQVERRWPYLEQHIKPGLRLLEIGCSSGFMLNAFRDYGLDCVGVDPSGGFVDFVKQNGHVIYKTLEEIPPNSQFDLVAHFFVFEHIRDPFMFMQKTYNLLKPGGKIIAEIPCVNDPLTSLYTIPAFEKFYWSIAHHYYYSPKSLSYILDKLKMQYELIPEQRYDLSNHIIWMTKGIPGGQGKYDRVFSKELTKQYKEDLIKQWFCDSMFLIINKQ